MFFERFGEVDASWIPTVLFGFLTLYITSYFLTIRRYPAGPLPLPIFGNVLRFRTKKRSMEVINEMKRIYGDIFTLWLGSKPFIFVCNFDNTKKALMESKHDFSGRISAAVSTTLFKFARVSIVFSDYGERWEVLRKIGHAAIRKYATSEKLPILIGDIADEVAQNMMNEKDCFDPKDHIYNLTFNIVASSLFGQRYQMHDKELNALKEFTSKLPELGGNGFPGDFSPLLRLFFIRREIILKKKIREVREFVLKKIAEHLKTFQADDVRDLTDSVIAALLEIEGTSKVRHFDDETLSQAILDMFGAAVDTTQLTARWVINYLAAFPDIQEKAIAEVREIIGDRIPVQSDRVNCPYLSAIIMETLRLRAPVPLALPHKTMCQTILGGQNIPKNTAVMFVLEALHTDSGSWDDPSSFRPERFITESNKIAPTSSLSGYVPFGQGRRVCIGEKLATNDLFIMFARLLQKGRFVAGDIDLEPLELTLFNVPKENKLRYVAH